MPVISRFYGILIAMYFNDHSPPHFHAKYSGCEAMFDFNGNVIEGQISPRATKLVQDWIVQHKVELEVNWRLAREGKPLNDIAPLE